MKTNLSKYTIAAVMLAGAAGTAHSATSYVTADVNLRSGPGTSHDPIVVVTADSSVQLHGCLQDRSWCKVDANGKVGWLSGRYVAYPVDGQRVALPQVSANVEIPLITTDASETGGAVTGAVAGAVVGGPVGAVVGAFIGANAVSAVKNPPVEVHTHIKSHPVETYSVDGELTIGVGLPEPVVIHTVPDYDYSYTVVNGKTVLVEPSTRRVVYIYD